ncbi:uncharacterized protein LOC100827023 [Brachypodium distachyon]|uniref:DUF4220 domain-containing protein n=1 Tax=Brachypodium distachyon TaxID=15368 RepID=I1GWR8_BRADI|nr:uncharacterized protein LOC100827023 [Brachypodium distachyon]KQK17429.2 hypothetical protein BRADI_1g34420v3 [Brachypodium distachyon]|eukprot:XP_003560524.1 uncharacterized protein LOC100827023 [Brachypodium distachyon]
MSSFGKKVVESWNDWQLIVLVLISLLMQLLLLFTAGFRKRTRPRKLSKIYFWVLHVGSRYIATYPLGILSRASAKDPNADIQAFWASLLLFHLGGPDDFTALSLEDNLIWNRQCFELTVQALLTAYVFSRYCVDKDFKCFIIPFVLISLAGLLKCLEQVFALRQATMKALIKSVLGTPDAGPDYADTMDRVNSMLRSGVLPSININDKRRLGRPNSDAREAGDTRAEQTVEQQQQIALNKILSAHSLFSRFKVLFADGIFSFEDRQESQALFLGKDAKWAFKVIEIELSFVYDRLYTKASVSRTTPAGMTIVRVPSLLLTLAGSVYTFLKTIHASQYSKRHRCVTYTLLAGAVLTEAIILARYIYSAWTLVGRSDHWLKRRSVDLVNRSRWSGYMAQSNLITFCLQKLPTDSQLEDFLVSFSRGRPSGQLDIPGAVIARNLGLHITAKALSLLRFRLAEAAPQLAGETLGAAARQYLQRRSMLEQLKSKSFWDKYKKRRYVPVQDKLTDFIFDQVKKKEATFNQRKEDNRATRKPDSHKPMTDSRGDSVIKEEKVVDSLGWSLHGKDFDESLLLWHIATDLCYREEVNQRNSSTDQQAAGLQVNTGNSRIGQQVEKHREIGVEISNYLLYIMVVHPLMLSSSTTMAIKRCRDTCAEARRHFLKEHIQTNFSSDKSKIISEENAHETLLNVDTPLRASVVKGDKSKSVLWDGCFLAKKLNEIKDRRKKWHVISRVWVEMLCYAAVQCGGYQHAERLKEGGELITFVCLLMTHLGMGKHYRTEVGDAYAHLSPFTAPRHPPAQADRPGVQQDATISTDEASTSGHGHGHL